MPSLPAPRHGNVPSRPPQVTALQEKAARHERIINAKKQKLAPAAAAAQILLKEGITPPEQIKKKRKKEAGLEGKASIGTAAHSEQPRKKTSCLVKWLRRFSGFLFTLCYLALIAYLVRAREEASTEEADEPLACRRQLCSAENRCTINEDTGRPTCVPKDNANLQVIEIVLVILLGVPAALCIPCSLQCLYRIGGPGVFGWYTAWQRRRRIALAKGEQEAARARCVQRSESVDDLEEGEIRPEEELPAELTLQERNMKDDAIPGDGEHQMPNRATCAVLRAFLDRCLLGESGKSAADAEPGGTEQTRDGEVIARNPEDHDDVGASSSFARRSCCWWMPTALRKTDGGGDVAPTGITDEAALAMGIGHPEAGGLAAPAVDANPTLSAEESGDGFGDLFAPTKKKKEQFTDEGQRLPPPRQPQAASSSRVRQEGDPRSVASKEAKERIHKREKGREKQRRDKEKEKPKPPPAKADARRKRNKGGEDDDLSLLFAPRKNINQAANANEDDCGSDASSLDGLFAKAPGHRPPQVEEAGGVAFSDLFLRPPLRESASPAAERPAAQPASASREPRLRKRGATEIPAEVDEEFASALAAASEAATEEGLNALFTAVDRGGASSRSRSRASQSADAAAPSCTSSEDEGYEEEYDEDGEAAPSFDFFGYALRVAHLGHAANRRSVTSSPNLSDDGSEVERVEHSADSDSLQGDLVVSTMADFFHPPLLS